MKYFHPLMMRWRQRGSPHTATCGFANRSQPLTTSPKQISPSGEETSRHHTPCLCVTQDPQPFSPFWVWGAGPQFVFSTTVFGFYLHGVEAATPQNSFTTALIFSLFLSVFHSKKKSWKAGSVSRRPALRGPCMPRHALAVGESAPRAP